jgi:hypothetical protein
MGATFIFPGSRQILRAGPVGFASYLAVIEHDGDTTLDNIIRRLCKPNPAESIGEQSLAATRVTLAVHALIEHRVLTYR